MRKTCTVMAMVIALALSAMAPALARGPSLERGNWLSGVAEPVDLDSGDVATGTLEDGTEYVMINHRIASEYEGYGTLVQREPVRYRQNVVTEAPVNYDSAWLGIAGPQGPEIAHKGPMHWYYEVGDDEWVSLSFHFNGRGELLRVNDVRLD